MILHRMWLWFWIEMPHFLGKKMNVNPTIQPLSIIQNLSSEFIYWFCKSMKNALRVQGWVLALTVYWNHVHNLHAVQQKLIRPNKHHIRCTRAGDSKLWHVKRRKKLLSYDQCSAHVNNAVTLRYENGEHIYRWAWTKDARSIDRCDKTNRRTNKKLD